MVRYCVIPFKMITFCTECCHSYRTLSTFQYEMEASIARCLDFVFFAIVDLLCRSPQDRAGYISQGPWLEQLNSRSSRTTSAHAPTFNLQRAWVFTLCGTPSSTSSPLVPSLQHHRLQRHRPKLKMSRMSRQIQTSYLQPKTTFSSYRHISAALIFWT